MTARPTLAEIHAALRAPVPAGSPSYPIAVLSNVTVSALTPMLQYLCRREGLAATVEIGGFDTVLQDALGGRPDLINADTACVVVILKLDVLSAALADGFTALAPDQVGDEVQTVLDYLDQVLRGLRERCAAPILLHGFETPLYPLYGALDAQGGLSQADTVAELNRLAKQLLLQVGNGFFIDTDLCLRRLGADRFYDSRTWQLARAPYSREACHDLAAEQVRLIRALCGKARKCLVLDCDNVLWGGVIGEDGLDGIKLGQSHPGSCYRDFQRRALALSQRGVILALVSKNNEADVWEVFDKHPDMVLKREHISAWRIDWANKADNLRALAAQLNIGLDSLVFIDDSPFEVELVRAELPMVAVLAASVEAPAGNVDLLARCSLFDTVSLSEEDRRRGALYRADSERVSSRTAFADLDAYLRSLEMRLDIAQAQPFDIPRLSQLTQRTNQFNLTTRRYSEDDIRALAATATIFSLSVADRFGDMGLVGCAILKLEENCDALLDTLLMSCRVLGRRVEDAFLAVLAEQARAAGAKRLIGAYRPTAKNGQVANFYADRGFDPLDQSDSERRFALDLADGGLSRPSVFAAIEIRTAP
jgi:FkbH-like protein